MVERRYQWVERIGDFVLSMGCFKRSSRLVSRIRGTFSMAH